ncbi:MAG: Gfo/Idh/MocA family protein [Bacilli bacterium]
MTRIGVLSTAHMHAHSYISAIETLQDVSVTGVYDENAGRGRQFCAAHGVPFRGDMEALLDESDAVLIAATNADHRRFVERAAARGVAILCEKPIATSVADAAAMVQAAESAGAPFYMALPVRFVRAAAELRKFVRAGKIGRILAMTGTNHGYMPGGWFIDRAASGGGAVMDHTSHVADLMRWIVGSDVVEVYAEIAERVHNRGIDDCGILTLGFANGVFATLDPSWSRLKTYPTWGDVTLEVVGTTGVLALDAFASRVHVYAEAEDGQATHRYDYYGDDMDLWMVDEFVRSVRSGQRSDTLATGLDGLRALEVTMAAYESAESGRPVAITPWQP